MLDSIPNEVEIPESLILAASRQMLVPFVGAGASVLVGYPTWPQFADKAIDDLRSKGKIGNAEYYQIKNLSPRTKLSLAVDVEERQGTPIDFKKILRRTKNPKNEVYDQIFRLISRNGLIVTTNYDTELDLRPGIGDVRAKDTTGEPGAVKSERKVIFRSEDISIKSLKEQNCTVHIHGSVADRKSMVITTGDYLTKYRNHDMRAGFFEENNYLRFLEQLFRSKNVIFIGYSADELEILEYVFQKSHISGRGVSKGRQMRHYMLQPFFSHELPLAINMYNYFEKFGIRLLPYSRDELDWQSTYFAVKRIADQLPLGRGLKIDKKYHMASLLK